MIKFLLMFLFQRKLLITVIYQKKNHKRKSIWRTNDLFKE